MVTSIIVSAMGAVVPFLFGGIGILPLFPYILLSLVAGLLLGSALMALIGPPFALPALFLCIFGGLAILTTVGGPWGSGLAPWILGSLSGTIFGAHLRYEFEASRKKF